VPDSSIAVVDSLVAVDSVRTGFLWMMARRRRSSVAAAMQQRTMVKPGELEGVDSLEAVADDALFDARGILRLSPVVEIMDKQIVGVVVGQVLILRNINKRERNYKFDYAL